MKQLFIGIILLLAGGGALSAEPQRYPDVVSAKVQPRGSDSFDFDVTVSSPYDTPARYADAFRVMGRDGAVFGDRILLHEHGNEPPFTGISMASASCR
ncbi:MAG: hypothetical protein NUV55_01980 [Sulfuricaulis sp.]|uniref:hypothetical protein n=1 Tax=Sulfuricaulis sp. TaxID=2003553 RepID=UPI0025E9BD49|nr:hypothetical protein [Sulfuricaulis sp.]MCR4345966.1 hypothetical protein [Sulfuricaulis sp.]